MADFPQTQNTGNLQQFIKDIPTRGVPTKVGQDYLTSIGLKSSNDRAIPTVLKALGVIDGSGAPTPKFQGLRNSSQAPTILAAAIKEAYKGLFETYPDANRKENDKLNDWFASHTSVGKASLRNIVGTFKALCALADFEQAAEPEDEDGDRGSEDAEEKAAFATKTRKKGRFEIPQVCFNIQVQIPGEQKPEVYESIFKNLGKYVLGIQDD